ncbi:MAG TPA: hypothetical protein VFC93_19825 [Chloroflexota bacterium]|nr:hypothetical protein [Chloroflexota bacterium]
MAFTVDDFHDLLRVLGEHPEWRAELRRYVLSEELLQLPELVRGLAEVQRRTDEHLDTLTQRLGTLTERVEALTQRVDDLTQRLGALTEQVDALTQRVDDLTQRLGALTERVDALTQRVDDLALQMQALVGRVGDMDGDLMELRFARRAPAYLGRFARRIRVVEPAQLADLLDDAVELGQLTEGERESAMLADVVARGRRRSDGAETYFVAEVSAGIGVGDVRRALERAQVLAKLGEPVVPVVVGRRINGEAQRYARSSGVEHVLVPARAPVPEGEPPSSR